LFEEVGAIAGIVSSQYDRSELRLGAHAAQVLRQGRAANRGNPGRARTDAR
jgi:hypothetical protein